MSNNLHRYSIQLAMIKQLLTKKLITNKEYNLVKSRLTENLRTTPSIIRKNYKNS